MTPPSSTNDPVKGHLTSGTSRTIQSPAPSTRTTTTAPVPWALRSPATPGVQLLDKDDNTVITDDGDATAYSFDKLHLP